MNKPKTIVVYFFGLLAAIFCSTGFIQSFVDQREEIARENKEIDRHMADPVTTNDWLGTNNATGGKR